VAEHLAGVAVERGLTIGMTRMREHPGECRDTPGPVLVWNHFSYYVASRGHALGGSSACPIMALPGPLRGREAYGPHPAPATPRGGSLSSAILYVAIVAIWACVLIPRWLRRDSSSSPSSATEEQASEDVADEAKAEEEPAPPARRPRRRRDDRDDAASKRRPVSAPAPALAERQDMPRDAHRRVLASRRRLLGMLVVLAIGAGALAGTRLAAWWVVLPPSVMLLGYLILLREAGKADAERRELARTRAVRAAVPPGRVTADPAGGSPARRAEIIDISASRGPGAKIGEEPYDQDEDAKLRAVGD
jgi:hypothetical protein